MSNIVATNGLRFIIFVLIQVLVLKGIDIGGANFNYISIIIYPLFIILLPLRTPHSILVLLGFLLGMCIDIFYDSYGIHASASVFSGYIRPYVLRLFAPKGGYNLNYSPVANRYGFNWFIAYAATMLFLHLFFYFSVDAFTFYYISDIALRTISTFIISLLIIIVYQVIFNPKE